MARAKKTTEAPATEEFTVTITGWVAGRRVTEGDTIRLSPLEAKYETGIVPKNPSSNPSSKSA